VTVELTGDLWSGAFAGRVAREQARAMMSIARQMEERVIRYTPVDTGEMKRGYVIDADVSESSIVVALANRADHADEVDEGQPAHAPNRATIRRYVERNIDKRKRNLTRRKRWIKKQIRMRRGRKRRSGEDRMREREQVVDAVTTMTVRAIRRSGTKARALGKRAIGVAKKTYRRAHRDALRRAVRRSSD